MVPPSDVVEVAQLQTPQRRGKGLRGAALTEGGLETCPPLSSCCGGAEDLGLGGRMANSGDLCIARDPERASGARYHNRNSRKSGPRSRREYGVIFLPWDPLIGCVEMVPSCAGGV